MAVVLVAVRRAACVVGWHGGDGRPVVSKRTDCRDVSVGGLGTTGRCDWACRREQYGSLFRPSRLRPSAVHRRVRSGRLQRILQLVHVAVRLCSRAHGDVALHRTARRCGEPPPPPPPPPGEQGTGTRTRGNGLRRLRPRVHAARAGSTASAPHRSLERDGPERRREEVARDAPLLPRLPP
jgi:hypothetical protein